MRTQFAGRQMAPAGHTGPVDCVADHVARLVATLGEVGALEHLDGARAVSLRLAVEATERGHQATAQWLLSAADRLWQQTVHLTECYS